MTNALDTLREVLRIETMRQDRSFDRTVDTTLFKATEERQLFMCIARGLDKDRTRIAAMAFIQYTRIMDRNPAIKENRLRLITKVINYMDSLNERTEA